jgi:hypothetical protein
MRSDLVELAPEVFDQDFGINAIFKPLHTEAVVPELAVKGFVHPIQPWLPGVNVGGVEVGLCQPAQNRSGDELRAIVTAQKSRCSVYADQFGEHFDDTAGPDASRASL